MEKNQNNCQLFFGPDSIIIIRKVIMIQEIILNDAFDVLEKRRLWNSGPVLIYIMEK